MNNKASRGHWQTIFNNLHPFLILNKLEFQNKELIVRAFTHSSYWNEHQNKINKNANIIGRDNERLEFLGDSILGFLVNEYLFQNFPQFTEGELAKIKSHVVSESILAAWARQIQVGSYLQMGKGEYNSRGWDRDSILADAMEAIIAALYLDQGIDKARKFVLAHLSPIIDSAQEMPYMEDYKSHLQELAQKQCSSMPDYETVAENGPEHNKSFVVQVCINGHKLGQGRGSSKKKAEQNAAADALRSHALDFV